MAKDADKPPYFVISTKRLTELSKDPPKTLDEWKNVGGVHPIVRRNARLLYDEVQKALKSEVRRPPVRKVHYTPKQAEHIRKLSEMREKAASRTWNPKTQ